MFHLKIGDAAPAFEGIDQDGKLLRSADFLGSKLVIFFYPQDNTPTCTVEACNLRDNYQSLLQHGFKVLGISPDSPKRHQNFISKYKLPFPLIADTERIIMQQYGIWGLKKFMGISYQGVHRTTFVIDEQGIIIRIFDKVKSRSHTEQILESFSHLTP